MRLAITRRRPVASPARRPAVDSAINWFVSIGIVNILTTVSRPAIAPSSPLPILAAVAAFCVAVLAQQRAPSLAWLAAIVGSLAAASAPIDQARAVDAAVVGVASWLTWAGPAAVGAIVTLWIAVGYATRPDRRLDPIAVPISVVTFGWFAIAIATTFVAAAAGARADPAFTWVDVVSAPVALFVPFVVLMTGLGIAADLRSAVERARTRLAGDLPRPGRADPLWTLAAATLRELIPGQAAADAAAIDAERVRLAGDLHAVVLPSLRRAIAEAEAGLPIENLAERLRSVDLELERLMADRWPVVLEAFGLVAALEDLAERTETESGVQVVLEIESSAGRPRPEIERTAWRVAQVALDNAIRHAAATEITIGIGVAPDRVRLSIADDGRGFDPTDPGRLGARGLADLGRRAAAVGGSVAIAAGEPTGTVVRFDWTS